MNTSESLDRRLAYGILRLTLGVDMLLHGFTRIFLGKGIDGFAGGLAREFAATPLPLALVHLFAVTLPFAEFVLGILLIFGLWTRWTLVAGGLLMTALVFGTAMRSQWETIGLQLTYSLLYAGLLFLRLQHNHFSVDTWLYSRKQRAPARITT